MKLRDIFKISIISVKLDLDVKSIEDFCLNYHENDEEGRVKSNMGGYQTEDLDYAKEEALSPLMDEIENQCAQIAKAHQLKQKMFIDNVWININEYKDYNIPHLHPDAVYSGCFYVKTPPDCGHIIIEHPALDLMNYYQFPLKYEKFNPYVASCWEMEVEENVMYVFPSWLKHNVEPNLNKEEKRISIAFNVSV